MIKYLIMDVDGTLTDGKIYMGPNGEAMKAFSVKDGYAINFILKPAGIVPIIITARTSQIVKLRCDELGIEKVYQGNLNKITVLKEIIGEDNLSMCAYFGDDILDLECIFAIKEAGGITGCPSDAVEKVKAAVDYISAREAGTGALREFSEWLVKPKNDENRIEEHIKWAVKYLQSLTIKEKDLNKRISVNENFFYFVQAYNTKPDTECKLKSHRNYIDIQMMVSGRERIDLADISRLTVKKQYDEKNDIMFWNIPQKMTQIAFGANDYIILYPEIAYRNCIYLNKSEKVLKIIGKIKIS